MPNFRIVYIANCHMDEDDSCDFKEWKEVTEKTSKIAIDKMSKHAMVLSCEEM